MDRRCWKLEGPGKLWYLAVVCGQVGVGYLQLSTNYQILGNLVFHNSTFQWNFTKLPPILHKFKACVYYMFYLLNCLKLQIIKFSWEGKFNKRVALSVLFGLNTLEQSLTNLNFSQDGTDICRGRLDDFGTILSPAFRAATVFVGIAVIISILCIISFILFFMCRYE